MEVNSLKIDTALQKEDPDLGAEAVGVTRTTSGFLLPNSPLDALKAMPCMVSRLSTAAAVILGLDAAIKMGEYCTSSTDGQAQCIAGLLAIGKKIIDVVGSHTNSKVVCGLYDSASKGECTVGKMTAAGGTLGMVHSLVSFIYKGDAASSYYMNNPTSCSKEWLGASEILSLCLTFFKIVRMQISAINKRSPALYLSYGIAVLSAVHAKIVLENKMKIAECGVAKKSHPDLEMTLEWIEFGQHLGQAGKGYFIYKDKCGLEAQKWGNL